MRLTRTADSLTVLCPAKLNLFLEVRGRRPDGYHEIDTVMHAVTLYDTLVFRPLERRGIDFACSDPDLADPAGNLVCRAADLVARTCGLPAGVAIRLEKRIPVGAGLGGGSSDAAGALAGLNELFGLALGRDQLRRLAEQLGSDVPFFLYGGTARCRGRGEKVTPVPANLTLHCVVCCPPGRLSTAAVYQNLARLGLTTGNRSASVILDSLAQGNLASLRAALFNRLDEAAVSLAPEIGRAKTRLAEATELRPLVSGSGAAVYTIVESEERATEAAEQMRARGTARVFLVRTESPAQA